MLTTFERLVVIYNAVWDRAGEIRAATPARIRQLLPDLIRQMWHAYWRRRARQAMLMFLHSLDGHTLKDFGVSREEMNCFLDEQFTRARCQRSMRGVAMLNGFLTGPELP
jgi:uncharacterized protein YjiS (DUF1127 family)